MEQNNFLIKVLLVDDDLETLEMIASAMEEDGFRVRSITSVKDLIPLISLFEPSVLVLDIEIGLDNGLDVASEVKGRFPKIPILFISSHRETEIMSRGIQEGEVYLKKPIELDELEAYIRKYAIPFEKEMEYNCIGDVCISMKTYEMRIGKVHSEKLSTLEFRFLSLLLNHANTWVTYSSISTTIWEKPFSEIEASLYNVVSKLRKKLAPSKNVSIIT